MSSWDFSDVIEWPREALYEKQTPQQYTKQPQARSPRWEGAYAGLRGIRGMPLPASRTANVAASSWFTVSDAQHLDGFDDYDLPSYAPIANGIMPFWPSKPAMAPNRADAEPMEVDGETHL